MRADSTSNTGMSWSTLQACFLLDGIQQNWEEATSLFVEVVRHKSRIDRSLDGLRDCLAYSQEQGLADMSLLQLQIHQQEAMLVELSGLAKAIDALRTRVIEHFDAVSHRVFYPGHPSSAGTASFLPSDAE